MGCLQIGIGPNANYSELRSMASAPESSNVIVSKDFSSLTDDLVFQISSLVCRSTSDNPSLLCTAIEPRGNPAWRSQRGVVAEFRHAVSTMKCPSASMCARVSLSSTNSARALPM